mmetsp:Transcript_101846/g.185922  ORF Transcript_101846/g.185922 Transcript_101846/m.185922 type:complete len:127 (+) Transcript_101846:108-488(+)
MASAGKALTGVAGAMVKKVKPSAVAGVHPAFQKAVPKAVVAAPTTMIPASATPEQKELIEHGYIWGVTWPGHVDKYHGKEPPMVDWGEIKDAFKTWHKFSLGTEYVGPLFSVMTSAFSSKLPGSKH